MKRIYRACERQVVYSLTTDRLVIYWATNNMLAGIYFNSHAQEMMKKQMYPLDFSSFPPLHKETPLTTL